MCSKAAPENRAAASGSTHLTGVHDAAGVVDVSALRTTFGKFPSGVTAVCAIDGAGQPTGMAVSAFVNVSLEPPLVGVFVQTSSTTWPKLRTRPRIGLSVLSADQHTACRQLASRTGNRFADLSWDTGVEGAIFLHGASAWFDCEIESESVTGDHTLALLRIIGHRVAGPESPLVFYESRFHDLSASARDN